MEPWIKVERVTANKTQVRLIARRLGIHQMHAFGCCVMFWIYADAEMTEGGIIPLLDAAELDKIVGLDGFSDALVAVHWIEFTDEGAVLLKHDAHMSQHAKARAQNNKDVANFRARKGKGDSEGVCKDGALQGRKGSTLPEKRIREKTSSASQKGESEGEAEDSIRVSGGAWEPILDELIDEGVQQAATTVRIAERKGYTPRMVQDLLAHYRIDPDAHGGPGAIYTRINSRSPKTPPDKGWCKTVVATARASPRAPIPADEQWRIDRIKALEPIHGRQEAKRMVDAELKQLQTAS